MSPSTRVQRSLPAFVLALTGSAMADPTEEAAATPEEDGFVLVTGIPSVVESRLSLFGAGEARCIDFSVAAIGEPAPELHVAAVGISGARVRALVDETLEEDCGATGRTGGFSAVLSDVDTAPRLVRLFIPSEAFPIRADGGSAKLLFVRLDAPVTEHAFVLQRQTHRYQSFFTWLLGVLTPVVIAVIGYFGKAWNDKRKNARETLADYRETRAEDLGNFFDGVYRTAVAQIQDSAAFRERVEAELRQLGVFTLPPEALRPLNVALRRDDRRAVGKALERLFPAHRDSIVRAHGKTK